jgi:hydroxylaminobenzene mutase
LLEEVAVLNATIASSLCFSGVLLFFLGLLTGFVIPAARSPRIGLSAHLTGVQSGTFLIAAGLLWPKLNLGSWSMAVGQALWLSLYAIWLSLVLAALFGAGSGLPIAGQGVATTRGKQAIVSVFLIGGSIVSAVAVAAMLIGSSWRTL